MVNEVSIDALDRVSKQFSYFDEKEKAAIGFEKSSFAPVFYQKGQFTYTPETEAYSYFGGTGASYKFGKTKIDALFAGKASKDDNHGYMIEFSVDQGWPDFMQPFENLTFSSNLRIRNNNCGCHNIQYRITPVKLSYDLDSSLIPVDNIYVYPAYAMIQNDLKDDNDVVQFGSLVGVSKKIAGKEYYVELQADTSNERSSDVNVCLNFGFKF